MMLSFTIALLEMTLYFQSEVRTLVLVLLPPVFFVSGRSSLKHILSFFLLGVITVILSSYALEKTIVSTSFPKEDIHRITGYVVSDGTLSSFNRQYLTLSLRECNTKNGAVGSARGVVSVMLPRKKMFLAGELISADGRFSEYGFNARSAFSREQNSFNTSRVKLLDKLLMRLDSGDSGVDNLSIMLLLGFSDVDNSELSLLARSSGTTFLLALSGMHIGLLSHLISLVLRPFCRRREAKAFSLLLLTLYIALIGPKPSIIRAYLLSLLFLIFPSNKAEENLFLTFLLQLLLFPESVTSLSAAFSYIALSGIIGLSSHISAAMDEIILLPLPLISSFSVSLAALIFSVPFTYMVFGGYQLSSLVSTIILTPLIYFYMLLSIVSLLFPLPAFFRSSVYALIKRIMELGSISMQSTLIPYFAMVFFVLCLLLLSYILKSRRRYVES